MASRRSFMAGMLAACAAPAVVKAGSLMKIVAPAIILPTSAVLNIGRGMTEPIWVMDEWVVDESDGLGKTYVYNREDILRQIETTEVNRDTLLKGYYHWGPRMPLGPEQASHFTKGQLIYANNDFLKRIGRR